MAAGALVVAILSLIKYTSLFVVDYIASIRVFPGEVIHKYLSDEVKNDNGYFCLALHRMMLFMT